MISLDESLIFQPSLLLEISFVQYRDQRSNLHDGYGS